MAEAKTEFRVLTVTEQLIEYLNDILPNFPKKERILVENIQQNEYDLIEKLFAYNINTSSKIKEKYIKEFIIKLSMCDFYLRESYRKKYISKHQMEVLTRKMIEMRKLSYGIVRSYNNVSKTSES